MIENVLADDESAPPVEGTARRRTARPRATQLPASGYVDDRYLDANTPFSRVWYQQARTRGEGPPAYKIGRRVVYRWDEVLAWLAASAVKVA